MPPLTIAPPATITATGVGIINGMVDNQPPAEFPQIIGITETENADIFVTSFDVFSRIQFNVNGRYKIYTGIANRINIDTGALINNDIETICKMVDENNDDVQTLGFFQNGDALPVSQKLPTPPHSVPLLGFRVNVFDVKKGYQLKGAIIQKISTTPIDVNTRIFIEKI